MKFYHLHNLQKEQKIGSDYCYHIPRQNYHESHGVLSRLYHLLFE